MQTPVDKEIAVYEAVYDLIIEGADVSELKVSDITARAGIGKGTVYGYFSSKDEIIEKAIFYYIKTRIQEIMKVLNKQKSFEASWNFLMDYIEKYIVEERYLIVIMDYHGKIREECETLKAYSELDPQKVFEKLAEIGIKERKLRADYPISYIRMSLVTRIFNYILYLKHQDSIKDCKKEKMKKLIFTGLKKELGY